MIASHIELVSLSISLALFAAFFDNSIMLDSCPIFDRLYSKIDSGIDQSRWWKETGILTGIQTGIQTGIWTGIRTGIRTGIWTGIQTGIRVQVLEQFLV